MGVVISLSTRPLEPPAARLGRCADESRSLALVLARIRAGRCPVVDTWSELETGAIMVPLPGLTTLKPGSASLALPGIGAEIVDAAGRTLERGSGYLTLTRPWPSMLRGIYGDPERYRRTDWSRFEGRYFSGECVMLIRTAISGCSVAEKTSSKSRATGPRRPRSSLSSSRHPSVAPAAVLGGNDAFHRPGDRCLCHPAA